MKNSRFFKKVLAIVVSLSLALSCSIPAFAAEDAQGAGMLEDLIKINTTSVGSLTAYLTDLLNNWSKNADSIKSIKFSDAFGSITELFRLLPDQNINTSEQAGSISKFGFDGKAITLDTLKESMFLLSPRFENMAVDTLLGSDNIETLKKALDEALNLIPTIPGAGIDRSLLTQIEDRLFEAFENAGVFKEGSETELNIVKKVLNVINEALVGREAYKASDLLNAIKAEVEKYLGENNDMTGDQLIKLIFSGIESYFNSAENNGEMLPDGTPVVLTLVLNDGSEPITVDAEVGQSVDLSEIVPVREGYTFEGWFGDADFTQAVTEIVFAGDVTIYAKWKENGSDPADENPFTDVNELDYFYNPVLWAVKYNITEGTSPTKFSPENPCTRAQAMTFLWRAAGEPDVSGQYNVFSDIKPSDYYYQAVLWGVSTGLTTGTSPTTFSPNEPCTRAQIVTFLYRGSGKTAVSGATPFVDVNADAYYAKAVNWAVSERITTGTSSTTFSPDLTCTRGQIVTFLYRFVN